MIVDVFQRPDDRSNVMFSLDEPPAVFDYGLNERLGLEVPLDRIGELVRSALIDEQAGLVVKDDLGDPRMASRYDGDAARQAFEERIGHAFAVAVRSRHTRDEEHVVAMEGRPHHRW